jgi:hypothetical protein
MGRNSFFLNQFSSFEIFLIWLDSKWQHQQKLMQKIETKKLMYEKLIDMKKLFNDVPLQIDKSQQFGIIWF